MKLYQRYHFYHSQTGVFADLIVTATDAACAALNTPPDHVIYEGEVDALCQKFDVAAQAVVAYQPPAPSADCDWDVSDKRWKVKDAVKAAQLQAQTATRRLQTIRQEEQPDLIRAVVLHNDPTARQRLKDLDDEAAMLAAQLPTP